MPLKAWARGEELNVKWTVLSSFPTTQSALYYVTLTLFIHWWQRPTAHLKQKQIIPTHTHTLLILPKDTSTCRLEDPRIKLLIFWLVGVTLYLLSYSHWIFLFQGDIHLTPKDIRRRRMWCTGWRWYGIADFGHVFYMQDSYERWLWTAGVNLLTAGWWLGPVNICMPNKSNKSTWLHLRPELNIMTWRQC